MTGHLAEAAARAVAAGPFHPPAGGRAPGWDAGPRHRAPSARAPERGRQPRRTATRVRALSAVWSPAAAYTPQSRPATRGRAVTVLVAAGSKHGATYEIAAAIGRGLAERGIDAAVTSVEYVADTTAFDAFVLGSAVYMGNWVVPARRFVERHSDVLSARPTWLFSSGPVGHPPKPGSGKAVQIDAIVAQTRAREHRLFTGKLDKSRLSFSERALVRAVRAPEGDFRDWDAIRAWAEQIAAELRAIEAVATCAARAVKPRAR